jgi:hypothetical protein
VSTSCPQLSHLHNGANGVQWPIGLSGDGMSGHVQGTEKGTASFKKSTLGSLPQG